MARSGQPAHPRARAVVYALAYEGDMSARKAAELVNVNPSTAAKWIHPDRGLERSREIYIREGADGTLSAEIQGLLAGRQIDRLQAHVEQLEDREPSVRKTPLTLNNIDDILDAALETVEETGIDPVVALVAHGVPPDDAESWYARAREGGTSEHALLRSALARWEITIMKRAGEGGPDAPSLIKLLGVRFPDRYTEHSRVTVGTSELEKHDGPRLDELSDEFGAG